MKISYLKYLSIILVMLSPLFSCNSQEEAKTIPTLSISGNENIESGGGICTIQVTATTGWKAHVESGASSWLQIKETGNDFMTVFVAPNPTRVSRTAQITVKLEKFDKSGVFRIVQKGKNADSVSDDPIALGYTLRSSMQGTPALMDKDYSQIHSHMKQYGWDYSEHPNSSDLDHNDGIHCVNIYDETLKQHVFKFMIHVNPFLDGDRGKLEDRQRNEMKSQTSGSWYKMNGNWDERQWLEWKFKIPKGFRPSTSFCHIHQLKAQEGNNGAPIITITLRGNNDGTNRRVQVIHTGDISSTNKGTVVDNISMEEFEDEWVQVQEEVHYAHNGFFRIKITRIRDNKVLIDYSTDNIDMWRKGATNIRNKFGIYRSYGKTLSDPDDRPSNGIKDESLFLGDFYIYEKNTNPNPQPHD
ncbi:BACON domain-containing protein [Proteiniphilum sp. UBA5384]|jgi:hypothetical protein|uniref:BACON domain-containing protein n=1 Tax=Proteiniphilum sp. UBA5384 TaxID=1947279 RepID=UPI0025DB2243|nr:BACON domain-containing carbohydrate-binding protein [Proteiniphilum sp. UBA5384]